MVLVGVAAGMGVAASILADARASEGRGPGDFAEKIVLYERVYVTRTRDALAQAGES